jgi:hypothetical protein
LNIAVHAFEEKNKKEAESDLLTAYMTAYFHRVDKLESFEHYHKKFSGQEEEKRFMTDEEMLAKVAELNAVFGGSTSK